MPEQKQQQITNQLLQTPTTPATPKQTKPLPVPTTPTAKTEPKPQTPTQPKQEPKPIPKETLILINCLESIEEILYATRQQILQLQGPVDYKGISDIELKFPEDLAHKLSFTEQGEYWIIKPKMYLGPDLFSDVSHIVKDILKGEYISDPQKKNSHFKIKRS